MNKRELFSNLQYYSLLFIIPSFILEFKLLIINTFILLIVFLVALLILIFAYYGKKKETGVVVASLPLALFNIIGYGILGVPEHFALREFISGILDLIVSLLQLAVIIASLLILKQKTR